MEMSIKYLPTHPGVVIAVVLTLITLPRMVAIGWQEFTPPKVASPSAVPVHPPPLK